MDIGDALPEQLRKDSARYKSFEVWDAKAVLLRTDRVPDSGENLKIKVLTVLAGKTDRVERWR